MSPLTPPGRPGLFTRDQVFQAITAPRSDVPVGPVTPQEAAGVIADLTDRLGDRLRPMLTGPHSPGEWRLFTRWFGRTTQVQSIVELLSTVERMAPPGPAGDGLRVAAEVVRTAALDIPRARIRRSPAWDADPADVEDDPYDPHGYNRRLVYQELADPEDVRDIEERLDRLAAAGEWLWRASSKLPMQAPPKPQTAAIAALASATGLSPNERKLVDMITAGGGRVSLSNLAVAMHWPNPDDNFNSACRRLNKKLKRLKPNGVKVSRENSVVVAESLPAIGRK